MRAAAFGESADDLALDFESTPRPLLISQLLGLHLHADDGGPSEAEVSEWPLPRRMAALLAIARASGEKGGAVEVRCGAPSCREFLELELDLAAFETPRPPATVTCEPEPGREVTLRLPRGTDQLTWLEGSEDGAADWRRMAASLMVQVDGEKPVPGDPLPRRWLEPIGEALEEADPLTALRLESVCPSCAEPVAVEFDLEEYLLGRLAARRERLLDQIHGLASLFHWNEAEVLALPRWRRDYYLSRARWETQP